MRVMQKIKLQKHIKKKSDGGYRTGGMWERGGGVRRQSWIRI